MLTDPIEFRPWPKTPRLRRQAWITEKIDGTNACVIIRRYAFGTHVDGVPRFASLVTGPVDPESGVPQSEYLIATQSRRRLLTPSDDNFGFARWAHEHADDLVSTLGEGYHYGEWWGRGIQRGYDLPGKRFSLFNTRRWWWNFPEDNPLGDQLGVVPVLAIGDFSTSAVDGALTQLRETGSAAAPGFMDPEGICIYHEQAGQVYKALLDRDHLSKTEAGRAGGCEGGGDASRTDHTRTGRNGHVRPVWNRGDHETSGTFPGQRLLRCRSVEALGRRRDGGTRRRHVHGRVPHSMKGNA